MNSVNTTSLFYILFYSKMKNLKVIPHAAKSNFARMDGRYIRGGEGGGVQIRLSFDTSQQLD